MEAPRIYRELTEGLTRPVRAEELVYLAPGLPTREQIAEEAAKAQSDKAGLEIAQGAFLGDVLADPDCGRHLIEAMLAPTPLALQHREAYAQTGVVDLGRAYVERRGNVGTVELRNPRHLNAEDDSTIAPLEAGIDLLLHDEATEVCVLRGGVVDHPRYAGRRIFGAGLNLTHLYRGQISYLFFPVRDLGLVHKVFRADKLWIAAAETFAIGGGCQLLLTVDHILCERRTRLTLPARNEGIIPGAANLRLPRFVGDRRARQAILSGEALQPEELADEIVEAREMDAALAARAHALAAAGAVSGGANKRAFRVGQEPLDVFREYMSVYCREQAVCYFSPALIRNLEENWRAHERGA